MSRKRLDNLVRARQLVEEGPDESELNALLRSAKARLRDAERAALSYDSRFDLAYNAAHAFALVALRRRGYRPRNRAVVFQVLPETAGLAPAQWRVLAAAHQARNVAEYDGGLDPDEQLLKDVIAVTKGLAKIVG